MRKYIFLLSVIWSLLILLIAWIIQERGYLYHPSYINKPLVVQSWWDELRFVGSPDPILGERRVPNQTSKVIDFNLVKQLILEGKWEKIFPNLNFRVGITDDWSMAEAALITLLARKKWLNLVSFVNPFDFATKITVKETEIKHVKLPSLDADKIDVKMLDFGKYKLVITPYKDLLGSWDILVYLGAGIDKKTDPLSGLINTFDKNKVCYIYLWNVVDKKGLDMHKFNEKVNDCFDFVPNNIYFYFPKYWWRASIPILFLTNSQYLKKQK